MIPIKDTGLGFKLIIAIAMGIGIWVVVLAIRQGLYGEKTKQEAENMSIYTIAPKPIFFGCVNFKIMESKLRDAEVADSK